MTENVEVRECRAKIARTHENIEMSQEYRPFDYGIATVRILDANLNRATEGLRVVEEFVRFVLEDGHLTQLCKEIRHGLIQVTSAIKTSPRLICRETRQDVGTQVSTESESTRDSLADIVSANFARAQQAIRCIEEYAKYTYPDLASAIEPLRYQTYTLQRAIDNTATNMERLADCRIYVLVGGCDSAEQFEQRVARLIEARVDAIQLRDKSLNDSLLIDRARRLRKMTRDSQVLCIINDRPDVAAITKADGVHLGQEDLSVKDTRGVIGCDGLIGVSTHSLGQAQKAVLDGASYLGCGPTFPSRTKSFDSFPGVDFLRQVAAEIRLPAFAIGGITQEHLPAVIAAGIRRIAVSGALHNAPDAKSSVAEMRRAIVSADRVNSPSTDIA